MFLKWRRARDFYRLALLVATRQTLHRRVCSLARIPSLFESLFFIKKSREIPFGISLDFMAESKGLLLSILYSSRCMLRVCLILHGVVPRPKNSPPDCFLNGLSNPLLTKKLRETSLRIFLLISWRRARDSNPRTVLGGYTISNRAPSTSSDNSPYLSNNY